MYNWNFVPLTTFFSAPTPVFHLWWPQIWNFFCWFVKYNWPTKLSSLYTTHWFNVGIYFKNGTVISLLGIRHHKNMVMIIGCFSRGTSRYLWPAYFVSEVYSSWPPLCVSIPSRPLPSGNRLFSLRLSFCPVTRTHLLCFDAIYTLNHNSICFPLTFFSLA